MNNQIKSILQTCGLITFGLIFFAIFPFAVCYSIANLLGFSGLLFGLLGLFMGLYLFLEASGNLRRNENGLWIIDHYTRVKFYQNLSSSEDSHFCK